MALNRRMTIVAAAAFAAVVTLRMEQPSAAPEAPLELKWAQLIPPSATRPPRSFLAGRNAPDPAQPVFPETGPDARWMSAPSAATRASTPPAVVESLNGKRILIGGYVVPLDFDATTVKEFLLVPFVGACIHVPPPPANQIVYVKTVKGIQVKSMFEPVYVTGTLTTAPSFTGLADAGYTLDAERVDPRKE